VILVHSYSHSLIYFVQFVFPIKTKQNETKQERKMLSESQIEALFESNNNNDNNTPQSATTPVRLQKQFQQEEDVNNSNNDNSFRFQSYQEQIDQQREQKNDLSCFENERDSQGSMIQFDKEYEIQIQQQQQPYQRSTALHQNDNYNEYNQFNQYESHYSTNIASTETPVNATTLNIYPSTTTIIQQQQQQEVLPRRRRRRVSRRDTVTLGGITIGWVLFVALVVVFGPFVLIPLFPLIPFFFIWWGGRDENANNNNNNNNQSDQNDQ